MDKFLIANLKEFKTFNAAILHIATTCNFKHAGVYACIYANGSISEQSFYDKMDEGFDECVDRLKKDGFLKEIEMK